jgi:hypothetical protein
MNKIKCFIACAFGKEDVDSLYNKAILIALDKLKIKGLRVDKINHNEKIDLKILDLIKKSEFGIADLTYARPSVYFEAGILEGQQKPVVFLARKDHFSSKFDDELGNYRIHFDLITKNIIPWEVETIDDQLVNKIKQRISLVIKPIQNKIIEETKVLREKETFMALSVLDRIAKLKSLTIGFISKNFKSSLYIENFNSEISIKTYFNGKQWFVDFLIQPTFTKNDLIYYRPFGVIWGTHWKKLYSKTPNVLIFIISLRPLRLSTIETVLSMCRKVKDNYYYHTNKEQNFHYFIIDKIDLTSDYKSRLLDCLAMIKDNSS